MSFMEGYSLSAFALVAGLIVVLSSTNTVTATPCQWPASVWCSSREIAKACHAEKACYHNEWEPTAKLQNAAAPRVRIGLLYESLCPDCRDFMARQIYRAHNHVGSIVNFTLIPFGNARESWNETKHRWDFKCQHGKRECIGNIIEACAIKLYPDQDVHIKFIYCIESSKSFPDEVFETCAAKAQMDAEKIRTCYTSKAGNTYEHQMALRTPDHKYVPWVTLNGVHTEKIQDEASSDIVKLICDSYAGTKPAACGRANIHTCKNEGL